MVLHALGRQRVKVIKSGRGFGKVGVVFKFFLFPRVIVVYHVPGPVYPGIILIEF